MRAGDWFLLPPATFWFFFFFNDTATTEIYTLSLHDALPISNNYLGLTHHPEVLGAAKAALDRYGSGCTGRSEEHTSELQSQSNLVCRLLLEKKKETLAAPQHPSTPGAPEPQHPHHRPTSGRP